MERVSQMDQKLSHNDKGSKKASATNNKNYDNGQKNQKINE